MIRRFTDKEFNITVATVLITVMMQFLFIRYASYAIEKNDFGNFVLLQTLIAGLSALFLQIPGQSFDRFYNAAVQKAAFINEFRTMLIAINALSLFVVFLYGLVIDKFTTEILVVVFIYFVLLNSYELNQKILLLNLQRGRYFYTKLLEALSKFILPIFAYIYFQTLASLFIATVIGYLIATGVASVLLREYPYRFVVKWQNLKKYFLFAYPIMFVSIFTWGISFSDRYFIEYYLSTEDVAIYSLLAMVAGVGQIVGQIYFLYVEPKVLKAYEIDPEQTFKEIASYLKKLLLVFMALTLIALLLPKEIYIILLEKKVVYNDYYFTTMMILLVSIFINILHVAHHMYLKLLKRLDILAYIFLCAVAVNLLLNTFIKDYGIMMGAVSTMISYITILILQIVFVRRQIKKNRIKSI